MFIHYHILNYNLRAVKNYVNVEHVNVKHINRVVIIIIKIIIFQI